MSGFLQSIIDAIYAFAAWLLGLVDAVLDGIFSLIKNAFLWAFDGLLGVVVSAVTSINATVPSLSTYWAMVPSEIINVLSLVGFGEAMAIISSAILIRLGLQLIPFVRLGS